MSTNTNTTTRSSSTVTIIGGSINNNNTTTSSSSSIINTTNNNETSQIINDATTLEVKFNEICESLQIPKEKNEQAIQNYYRVKNDYILEGDPIHWLCCSLYVVCRKSDGTLLKYMLSSTSSSSTSLAVSSSSSSSAKPLASPSKSNSKKNNSKNNQNNSNNNNNNISCNNNENNDNTRILLTKLLRYCNITFYEFVKRLKLWNETIESSSTLKLFINNLSNSLAVSLLVYEKFGIIFRDLFINDDRMEDDENNTSRTGDIVGISSSSSSSSPSNRLKSMKRNLKLLQCTTQNLHAFCWYLFICVKSEYPENTVDLVTSVHMLFCCLDIMFANCIYDKRYDLVNGKFKGVPDGWNAKGCPITGDVDPIFHPICIMKILCEKHEGTIVDAITTKQYGWKEAMKKYFEIKILSGNDNTFLDIISTENFDGNFKALRKHYEEYILYRGEIDESIFLAQPKVCDKDILEDSDLVTRQETPITRRNYLPAPEINGGQSAVSIATQSVQRLRSHVTPTQLPPGSSSMVLLVPSTPPQSLCELCKQCEENPMNNIEIILEQMYEIFKSQFEPCPDDRFKLAKSVYYRLLENILKSERSLNKPNFDLKILNSDMLHKTLIACSVEIVIYAYRSPKEFPWILHCFNLDAFNFYKILELIVLYHGDILSRDIIKHLNAIEEQCIESLAWKSNSPLWDLIGESKEPLPKSQIVDRPLTRDPLQSPIKNAGERINNLSISNSIQQQLPTTTSSSSSSVSTPSSSSSSSSLTLKSSISPQQIDDVNGLTTTTSSSSSNSSSTHRGSLILFFRKFYKLAYLRISELCKDLKLRDHEHLQKVWTIFEFSIVSQIQLMRNRHLDQITMCAIYLFARVSKFDIKFKDIMYSYRAQSKVANVRSHIYREVLIEPDDESESNKKDIIAFYNNVYVRPQEMQIFAMRFSQNSTENVILSPLPANQTCKLLSPMKLSENHQIFIHAMEPKDLLTSPGATVFSLNNPTLGPTSSSSSSSGTGTTTTTIKGQSQTSIGNGKRKLPFNTGDDGEIQQIIHKQPHFKLNKCEQPSTTTYKRLQTLISDREINVKQKK